MDLRWSLVAVVAALTSVPVISLPGILLIPGTHRRFDGPGRELKRDLKWWVTADRRSIALSSDKQSVQSVSECSMWIAVARFDASAW